MKLIHQKSVLLLVLLIGFAFIAIGLAEGTIFVIGAPYKSVVGEAVYYLGDYFTDPCFAGLPLPPPPL